jgi:hypothetical protein
LPDKGMKQEEEFQLKPAKGKIVESASDFRDKSFHHFIKKKRTQMRTRKCSNVSHKAEDVISTLEKNN